MVVTLLGTGTSHGIPVIGCDCKVCTSHDSHDKRYRSSIMLEEMGKHLVIDTGYEFRLQLLRENVTSLDGVLYTHSHTDHCAGLDDLRVFSRHNSFPIYGDEQTLFTLKKRYPYAIDNGEHPGLPVLKSNVLAPYKEVEIARIKVVPIPVYHGNNLIYGYRFGTFAYLTDVSDIPDESYVALKGVKLLVLGALRERPHSTHFSFSQAYQAARKIGVAKVYFTHINHETCYSDINRLYPGFVESAYDGLVINI
ncbi:MAG: MBL fold metallo-hydrolase [Bacteroidales bacterium]|nr:MBL fold metallo-hydrolase [Bacteroidales bacterium]